MASIFTKIIKGDIPSYKVAESEKFYAFLDIRPLKKGHTLVIPKEEIDYFFNVDDDLMKEYMVFAKKVAKALEKVIPCTKVGMTVIGLEVPHAHIHLVPINNVNDMSFSNGPVQVEDSEMAKIATSIQTVFDQIH